MNPGVGGDRDRVSLAGCLQLKTVRAGALNRPAQVEVFGRFFVRFGGMGGLFVLLIPLALLNSEGTGLDYTKTLPLDINRIIISKTFISAMTYLPVPIILFVLSFFKPITSMLCVFIPTFVLLSIISASIFEIQLFLNYVTKGRISALIHDFKTKIALILIVR